jgi:hypothetical protein
MINEIHITITEIHIYEISSLAMNLKTDEYNMYHPDKKIIIPSNNAASASIFPLQ